MLPLLISVALSCNVFLKKDCILYYGSYSVFLFLLVPVEAVTVVPKVVSIFF